MITVRRCGVALLAIVCTCALAAPWLSTGDVATQYPDYALAGPSLARRDMVERLPPTYRARDERLGREVALKLLHQSLGSDEALVAMFERCDRELAPLGGLVNNAIKAMGGSPQPWLTSPWLAFSAICLSIIWKSSSFVALVLLAGLQTIPKSLYEAAEVDGATTFQQFREITLPMLPARTEILLDGRVVLVPEPGRAIPIEPGRHTLSLEVARRDAKEYEFVVQPGEHVLVVNVTPRAVTRAREAREGASP